MDTVCAPWSRMRAMKTSRKEVGIGEGAARVSGLLDRLAKHLAVLVLAHGAGAGMKHPSMEALAGALNARSVATLRFQFPYMEKGGKRPDRPAVATAAIQAAVEFAKSECRLPVFAGGESFGGRMTTLAASLGMLDGVRGLVCFSYPLHRPKLPSLERAEHLKDLKLPTLWIQGKRDEMSDGALTRQVVKRHPKFLRAHFVEGADHGYGVLKSSGRAFQDVLDEVADTAAGFIHDRAV